MTTGCGGTGGFGFNVSFCFLSTAEVGFLQIALARGLVDGPSVYTAIVCGRLFHDHSGGSKGMGCWFVFSGISRGGGGGPGARVGRMAVF